MNERPRLNGLEDAQRRLNEDVTTVQMHRELWRTGRVVVDRYKHDVVALASDEKRMVHLENLVNDYEARWNIPLASTATDHTEAVVDIIMHHHASKIAPMDPPILATPLAVLFDIANRSSLGVYSQKKAPLSTQDNIWDTEFVTLSHSLYWRQQMAKQAVNIASRFRIQSVPFDLVMVGDGSGLIGATLMRELLDNGIDLRIYHLDIGSGSLALQRETYERNGIESNRIIPIQAQVTEMAEAMQSYGIRSGFIVAHEILDALRTHSLVTGPQGIREIYQIISPNDMSLQAFSAEEPLLRNILQFFPWYAPSNGELLLQSGEKMIPFAPGWIKALQAMVESLDQSMIYIGDYSGQFTIDAYNQLPMRAYGRNVTGSTDNYLALTQTTVDMTTDVPPSILHLASRWGGRVEFLGTQQEFITQVDESLPGRVQQELQRIKDKTEKRQYAYADVPQLYEDLLFTTEIASAGMFAGIISKNI